MKQDYGDAKLPPFCLLDEPTLVFGDGQLDTNPLRGLRQYGPYSQSSFKKYTPELRIATIGPQNGFPNLRFLVDTLRNAQSATDRKEYVPDYPGFEQVFGIPISAASREQHIQFPNDLSEVSDGSSPQEKLMHILRSSIQQLTISRDQFDIVLVYLPDSWSSGFNSEGFNARHELKAIAAEQGIPTQIINERVFSFPYRASLAWRLSTALYAKGGGVPWKLHQIPEIPEGTAYIGLAYALRGNPSKAHYVTCCSQVFDADGGGMQFVAFEASDPVTDFQEAQNNPFLSRADMRAVLARSLDIYRHRNGGFSPRRLVVHKTTAFKSVELEGVMDATSSISEVECTEIGASAVWRGVWRKKSKSPTQKSQPDGYPTPRGTFLTQSGNSALIWVAGNAPSASTGSNFYQGGKSIPAPLKIIRHAGSGPMETSALEVLALTKMNWNNDALYDSVPVTIGYSQQLASTIANVPSLPGRAYPYRLFM